MQFIISKISLLIGWILDLIFGDPEKLPHPVVGFGKIISYFEKTLNNGDNRKLKGGITAGFLILATFVLVYAILFFLSPFPWIKMLVTAVGVFYCLAGTTLIREVKAVFAACDRSLEEGRMQVARIVGRDTANLTDKEVKTAALETLAENLSDGVIAPLFWYALLGLPGMMAYKMVNTLDSMIGYKNERYGQFGYVAAHIDDIANLIPARLTALLMIIAAGKPGLWRFVMKFGPQHASPNSGWPEAALAGILNCRFGGTHDYFGNTVYKPYIGTNDRNLTYADMLTAVRVNRIAESIALLLCILL
ncbi:MAG: adenosylcobinamide-phosphate synthase CbiB [Muribaculum sp.]|nr:adenosylcobinamide-phosphate synthase CbiB [Muribaculum sp.]